MNYNLCDEFIKYKKYLGYKYKTETIVIKEIKSFLIDNKITEITKEVIESYARLNTNLSSNTLARNMGTFREFCIYLKMQDIECYQIPKCIYPQKVRKYVPYIFSKDEITNILAKIEVVSKNKPYSYVREQTIPLIIRILYQTGMRIGEVLNLKIEDYNYLEGYFNIKEAKNNEERRIYLPDSLNIKVLNYHNKFHTKTNNIYFFQLGTTKIEAKTIDDNFYKALNLCNIKRKENSPRLHDLRHTFVVRSIEKAFSEGKDFNLFLPYLQAYVGHKSITSLEYYFHLTKPMISELNPLINDKFKVLIPKLKEDYE